MGIAGVFVFPVFIVFSLRCKFCLALHRCRIRKLSLNSAVPALFARTLWFRLACLSQLADCRLRPRRVFSKKAFKSLPLMRLYPPPDCLPFPPRFPYSVIFEYHMRHCRIFLILFALFFFPPFHNLWRRALPSHISCKSQKTRQGASFISQSLQLCLPQSLAK